MSYAWSNLGVVFSRNNQFEAAEAAFSAGNERCPQARRHYNPKHYE
ncbi:MAG: hypothetical protein JW896_17245 [Deltaproteobacteria bacterium]|nr:hypothetical protein [Deltaproteobacteria bacterium]